MRIKIYFKWFLNGHAVQWCMKCGIIVLLMAVAICEVNSKVPDQPIQEGTLNNFERNNEELKYKMQKNFESRTISNTKRNIWLNPNYRKTFEFREKRDISSRGKVDQNRFMGISNEIRGNRLSFGNTEKTTSIGGNQNFNHDGTKNSPKDNVENQYVRNHTNLPKDRPVPIVRPTNEIQLKTNKTSHSEVVDRIYNKPTGSQADKKNNLTKTDSNGRSGSSAKINNNIKKKNLRLFIKLSEPYHADFSFPDSEKFKKTATRINSDIKKLFVEPDFSDSEVVAIMLTSKQNITKAYVNIKAVQSKTEKEIHNIWDSQQSKYGFLREKLEIKNNENMEFLKCNHFRLPCANSSSCYPTQNRCNDLTDCEDKSDELDCPGKNDANVKSIINKCSGNFQKYHCHEGGAIISAIKQCDGELDCP